MVEAVVEENAEYDVGGGGKQHVSYIHSFLIRIPRLIHQDRYFFHYGTISCRIDLAKRSKV